MDILQQVFEEELNGQLGIEVVLARIVSHKFQEYGVVLTESQEAAIENQFKAGKFDQLDFALTDEQEAKLKSSGDTDKVVLELNEKDVDVYFAKLTEVVSEVVSQVPATIGRLVIEGFKEQTPEALRQKAQDEQAFRELLLRHWGKPLILLETLIGVCLELGFQFNEHFGLRPDADRDLVAEALIRLHARGCQVSSEIVTLLKHGFAEGAYARWRTLHEMNVTGNFLARQGSEVAERYLMHHGVSDYKDALDYQKHCVTLGWAPISADELLHIKEAYDQLLEKYGEHFKNKYGWAAKALGKANPNFSEIEQLAGLSHSRPFYLMGNLSVHASSKGTLFRLGAPPGSSNMLVAGPSLFGFAEPGQATAWTMNQLTGALLLTNPNIDSITLVGATSMLVDEIYEAFYEAENTLESSK